ncbi:MAG: bifunctional hydroxymethylpyrimidine kinase/phosphomethylpyrimidine kinase, partial [bacterium]|nr:bifunctional hydroxymethylpyrimidine kinase/phosphomethylpyrimidine kinase [bacterium]
KYNVPFLVKGGHLDGKPSDLLVDSTGFRRFEAELVAGVNTHGSGCTLSAAITAGLARGQSLRDAIHSAKTFITQTLLNPLQLSENLRIINHFPL